MDEMLRRSDWAYLIAGQMVGERQHPTLVERRVCGWHIAALFDVMFVRSRTLVKAITDGIYDRPDYSSVLVYASNLQYI